ncbi:plasma-membrane choline transporter-domain-containing protein [Polychytrium aggregatum]|uniref:plasma-membrane choline transporter-domain-containing protein n=1 Tax=Polychytrium aggregatum TaxID=110093 RepID=UPI0022FDBB32|nr:plasma-membrane choline transporter-domain-containing protein [Polychytrium aggregatum]KAI9202842.1 plasma-membrane choline transporter-domain-containing protein [Polychytrium aggregatum]
MFGKKNQTKAELQSGENPLQNSASGSNPQQSSKIVERRPWRDLWAAALFLAGLGAFVYAAYLGIPNTIASLQNPGSPTNTVFTAGVSFWQVIHPMITMLATALGATLLAVGLIQAIPRFMMNLFYGVFCVFIILIGAYVISYGGVRNIVSGCVVIILAGLYVWGSLSFYETSEGVANFYKASSYITRQFPATIFASFLGMIISLFFIVTWLATSYGITNIVLNKYFTVDPSSGQIVQSNNTMLISVLVGLALILFWTLQVIQNVVYVTCSGLLALVFYQGTLDASGKIHIPTQLPTLRAAGRALTSSFGSICFGSLLISIIQTLRYLANIAQNMGDDNGDNFILALIRCCLICILVILQDILYYFNHFAFAHVAVYGDSFCQAAKSTWRLLESEGLGPVIVDNLVDSVVVLGGVTVGLITGLAAIASIESDKSIPQTNVHYITYCSIGFALGAYCFFSMMTFMLSAVSTTIVCYADSSTAVSRILPRISTSWL